MSKKGWNFCLKSHGDGHQKKDFMCGSVAGVALMDAASPITASFTAKHKT